jgi:hypothetical protein
MFGYPAGRLWRSCRARGWSITARASRAHPRGPAAADDPAEENDAILVGDSGDGVDDRGRGLLAQAAGKRRQGLVPSHPPERAGGGEASLRCRVVGELEQPWHQRQMLPGAIGGGGAQGGVGIPQEIEQGRGRQHGTEPRRDADGMLAVGPLNDAFDDQPDDGAGRRRPTDLCQRIERRHLLGHRPLEAEAQKAPAKVVEGRHRLGEPTPSGLGRQDGRLRQPCLGKHRDERLIVQIDGPGHWRCCRRRRSVRRLDSARREEIELPFRHCPFPRGR